MLEPRLFLPDPAPLRRRPAQTIRATSGTYRLSTYDPADDFGADGVWTVRHSGLSLWRLRDAVREARGMGYDDDLSILVEREEP